MYEVGWGYILLLVCQVARSMISSVKYCIFTFHFLLTVCILIPLQDYQRKTELKVRQEPFLWPMALCFMLTNLQRPPLDLLTVLSLMGNDDTDGPTTNLPSGHLAGCHFGWLRRPTSGHLLIFFFLLFFHPEPMQLPLGLFPVRPFSIVLTVNFDLSESAC